MTDTFDPFTADLSLLNLPSSSDPSMPRHLHSTHFFCQGSKEEILAKMVSAVHSFAWTESESLYSDEETSLDIPNTWNIRHFYRGNACEIQMRIYDGVIVEGNRLSGDAIQFYRVYSIIQHAFDDVTPIRAYHILPDLTDDGLDTTAALIQLVNTDSDQNHAIIVRTLCSFCFEKDGIVDWKRMFDSGMMDTLDYYLRIHMHDMMMMKYGSQCLMEITLTILYRLKEKEGLNVAIPVLQEIYSLLPHSIPYTYQYIADTIDAILCA